MRLFPLQAMPAISYFATGIMLTLFGALCSAASLPDLTPFKANYTAYKWGDDVGEAKMKLEALDNNQFSLTYSSDVSKFFLSDERFEHSIFFVDNEQLIPSQYHYKRTGTGPDSALSIAFTTEPSPQIKIDKTTTLPWKGELDNQLYRLDISRQLAAGNHSVSYDFVNYRGEKRHYGIEVMGKETLSLPYGVVKTIKVKLLRESNTRETFAWFAPSLDYHLVRLQQFKDGDEQGDIKLRSFQPL